MSTMVAEFETAAHGSPAPRMGETYAQFVQRAHYALMPSIPDWQDRNEAVWSAWERSNGELLRDRAKQYFSQHRFVPNVCYFSEHETIGSDGKPVRYSFSELADICDEHNSRADRHNYSALAERHTVNGILPKELEPRVVGYTGSSRLGMVGNTNPQWAVFVDEHHKTDSYSQSVLSDKQRRSVEVNRWKDGRARPYFDPIAVLGADSPRLPLPVARYQASEDSEALVDRYSVVAPAMVSGTNSFIPAFGQEKPKPQYSEPNMDQDFIPRIVQAIQQTPEMQWVRQQMGNAGGAGGAAGAQPAGSPSPMQPGGQAGQGGQYMQSPLQRYQATESDDMELVERYSKLESELNELKERYSKVNEVNVDLMKQHGQVRQAVIELERRECDKDRELKIRGLYSKFPHFVDVDEELDRCLYSRGSAMSVEQFDNHVESVERYAARSSPVTRMIPNGQLPNESDKEQYEARLAEMVVERYSQYERKGQYRTYDELEAEIRKELTGK